MNCRSQAALLTELISVQLPALCHSEHVCRKAGLRQQAGGATQRSGGCVSNAWRACHERRHRRFQPRDSGAHRRQPGNSKKGCSKSWATPCSASGWLATPSLGSPEAGRSCAPSDGAWWAFADWRRPVVEGCAVIQALSKWNRVNWAGSRKRPFPLVKDPVPTKSWLPLAPAGAGGTKPAISDSLAEPICQNPVCMG